MDYSYKNSYSVAINAGGQDMRTVQMTLDEELIEAVDKVVKKTGTTRSAFAREALYVALRYEEIKEKEQKHREGYARKPVQSGEFSSWEDEQVWAE